MAQQTRAGRTQRGAFIDDEKWEAMRREAFERRCSVSDVLNEVIEAGLKAREEQKDAKK
jgi:hypothetical protein